MEYLMHTSNFSRLHFAHLPTPLEPMQNISKALGGPNLWIKRDDCTGLSSGGNKTRKLEFIMADAVDQKADTIITQGATPIQSCAANLRHCWQTGHAMSYFTGKQNWF